MVVDTSVLVALFLSEPGHEVLTNIIDDASEAYMSVVSRIELIAVLCGKRHRAAPELVAEFIDGLNLDHVPVSIEQMNLAIAALLRFGRGRHAAKLNFGD